MAVKFIGSFSRILKKLTKKEAIHNVGYCTVTGLKGVVGEPTSFCASNAFRGRLQCQTTRSPSQCLLQRTVTSPYLTPSATLLTEIDVSKIPKQDPIKGRLVYAGTLANMVKAVKAFSVSTSMLGVCLQPYLYVHAGDQPLVLTVAIGSMLSFFIFLTPVMLHFVTKRYVTRLYYDDTKGVFTATNYTFFVREKDTEFKSSDVSFPEVPGLFTTMKVKDTPLFVDPTMFLERDAYIRLMGYDKPMDWKMPTYEDDKKE